MLRPRRRNRLAGGGRRQPGNRYGWPISSWLPAWVDASSASG